MNNHTSNVQTYLISRSVDYARFQPIQGLRRTRVQLCVLMNPCTYSYTYITLDNPVCSDVVF